MLRASDTPNEYPGVTMPSDHATLLNATSGAVHALARLRSLGAAPQAAATTKRRAAALDRRGRMILASFGLVIAYASAGEPHAGEELATLRLSQWLADVEALEFAGALHLAGGAA